MPALVLPTRRCPPRPLAGLTSGDWREQEWKSRWDVQPLQDWTEEVSERTWVRTEQLSARTADRRQNQRLRYLHGARLAVAGHWRPPQQTDRLRQQQGLVGLVLREVLQAALVGLLVFVLRGEISTPVSQKDRRTGPGPEPVWDAQTSEEAGLKPKPRGALSSSSQPLTPGLK